MCVLWVNDTKPYLPPSPNGVVRRTTTENYFCDGLNLLVYIGMVVLKDLILMQANKSLRGKIFLQGTTKNRCSSYFDINKIKLRLYLSIFRILQAEQFSLRVKC